MVSGLKMLMEPINQFGLVASVKRVLHKTSIFEKLDAPWSSRVLWTKLVFIKIGFKNTFLFVSSHFLHPKRSSDRDDNDNDNGDDDDDDDEDDEDAADGDNEAPPFLFFF